MSVLMEQIKGHDLLQSQFQSALKKNHLPHALLFVGPSGVGKQKMAWALAQTLLCQESESACGECFPCLSAERHENENILFITSESLQIKLEEAKKIISFLSLQTGSSAKIVIVNEADQLNIRSINSLLKIIEEPPQNSFFIFISSSLYSFPMTLRSRFQIIKFNPLSFSVMKEITSESDELIFASKGRLDILKQLQDKDDTRVLAFELWKDIFRNTQLPSSLDSFAHLNKQRKEAVFISRCWQEILRDARYFQAGEKKHFIHIDQLDIIKDISTLPARTIDLLIQETFKLEKDLLSNLNCVLCFENFMLSLQQIIQKD